MRRSVAYDFEIKYDILVTDRTHIKEALQKCADENGFTIVTLLERDTWTESK